MANPTRILFVSGEVAPFAERSDTASLVRTRPEQLLEAGDIDARIMMPRYGTISERKNRLHEVIRLSGTTVTMGEETETLKVKVASIPGVRLQVYFMDNKRYFKRKGIYADRKTEAIYEDNDERALFFGRSVLRTIKKLGWGPDVVHVFGWMAVPVAILLRTEFADDELFQKTKILFSPDGTDFDADVSADVAEALGLDAAVAGTSLRDLGLSHADLVAVPDFADVDLADAASFSTGESLVDDVMALYDQALGVPA